MKSYLILIVLLFTGTVLAQNNKNIRYEYKKFESFDFEEIGVEGVAGAPGDLSISPRLRNEFKNRLPERQNFNKEMKKAVQGIR
jgi:hypothetical protein